MLCILTSDKNCCLSAFRLSANVTLGSYRVPVCQYFKQCEVKQAVREAATIPCNGPCKLTFDLLTLKVVS